MTVINDILIFFETFAPTDTAMDFDNVGLLVGDKNTAVTKALVALDITSQTVQEAKEIGCELIISHHPVIFNPVKKLSVCDPVYQLAKNSISALCMHTNLDLAQKFGVNTCLAKALGVINPVKSNLGECMFIGNLEAEVPMEEFAKRAKAALDCRGLRYTDVKPDVKTVAVSSGAGGSDIFAAANENVDVFVTGEIKHHEIMAANEMGINIVEAGHFKSEDVVINPLVNLLSEKFNDIIFTKSQTCDDKVKFI